MEIQKIDIRNLIPGMQNVEIVSKIGKISEKEFKTEKAEGKLANIMLYDESGSIRLVLWNDEIDNVYFYSEVTRPISGYTWLGELL